MMANLDCHLVWIKRHLWDEVGHACEDVSRGNWTIQANKGLFIKDIIIGLIPWWSQNTMTFLKGCCKVGGGNSLEGVGRCKALGAVSCPSLFLSPFLSAPHLPW